MCDQLIHSPVRQTTPPSPPSKRNHPTTTYLCLPWAWVLSPPVEEEGILGGWGVSGAHLEEGCGSWERSGEAAGAGGQHITTLFLRVGRETPPHWPPAFGQLCSPTQNKHSWTCSQNYHSCKPLVGWAGLLGQKKKKNGVLHPGLWRAQANFFLGGKGECEGRGNKTLPGAPHVLSTLCLLRACYKLHI